MIILSFLHLINKITCVTPTVPGVRRMYCKGSRQLNATDDVKWYIATGNCNAPIPVSSYVYNGLWQ